MHRFFRSTVAAAFALLLSACSDVTCRQIAGDTPAKLDPKLWNGAWSTNEGGALHARVKEADKGVLEVAWLEVTDDAIELKKFDIYIRQAGGWLWGSYRESSDKDYAIARVGEPGEHLLVWPLLSAPVIQRVKSGKLKGEVLKDDKGKETKSVRLDELHDADLQAIREGKWGEMFDWDKPALNLKYHKD